MQPAVKLCGVCNSPIPANATVCGGCGAALGSQGSPIQARGYAGNSRLPLMISCAALAISIVTGVLTIYAVSRSPFPGKGIAAYDYSTPQAAIRSQMEIGANGDIRADIERQVAMSKSRQSNAQKQVDSLQFGTPIEYDGKVLVFYKYSDGGLDRFETHWMEKDAVVGYRYAIVDTSDWDRKGGDEGRIAKKIADWEAGK